MSNPRAIDQQLEPIMKSIRDSDTTSFDTELSE